MKRNFLNAKASASLYQYLSNLDNTFAMVLPILSWGNDAHVLSLKKIIQMTIISLIFVSL
jgi:hypothetical protein